VEDETIVSPGARIINGVRPSSSTHKPHPDRPNHAGNHFLTVFEGDENLRPLGEMTLWQGAQEIVFTAE
jgi:hypothetical protein